MNFVELDPIARLLAMWGVSRHVYATDNPVRLIDASGARNNKVQALIDAHGPRHVGPLDTGSPNLRSSEAPPGPSIPPAPALIAIDGADPDVTAAIQGAASAL